MEEEEEDRGRREEEGGRKGRRRTANMAGVGSLGSLAPWALQLDAPLSVGQLNNMIKNPRVSLLEM